VPKKDKEVSKVPKVPKPRETKKKPIPEKPPKGYTFKTIRLLVKEENNA
jgi:hypothetical protein